MTRDTVYFGESKVSGLIAEDGITIKPVGAKDVSRMTITFLLGTTYVEDTTV